MPRGPAIVARSMPLRRHGPSRSQTGSTPRRSSARTACRGTRAVAHEMPAIPQETVTVPSAMTTILNYTTGVLRTTPDVRVTLTIVRARSAIVRPNVRGSFDARTPLVRRVRANQRRLKLSDPNAPMNERRSSVVHRRAARNVSGATIGVRIKHKRNES